MKDRKRTMWGYLFITPQLIGLLCFSLIPVIYAIVLSFMEWNGFGDKHFVGFANYITQFKDHVFWKSIINTLYYMILTIPVGIALSLILAIALNRIRGKNIYRVFYFMPVVTSMVSIAVIWMWLLNGKFGILNQLLSVVGITGPDWLTDTQWVMVSIAMLSIWASVGYNMVIFLAGLQGIPNSYYEAAEIDGARPFQKFRYITFPMVSPTTFFITIMSIIGSFQVFDQAYVMTNGGPAKASYTIVYHIFHQGFEKFDMGLASSASVILFVIILAFTLIQFKLQKRWVHYED
ncbi:multiple sugar transport system permease protein [Pullulanibacillus pueri]|uniref:Sugar ABC transporter permease n=1 Tax=Pullulanibacillus pueri TaxID=1437324 RepID=A0A8J3EPP0_9BACL|nr:sugar ABC transporter permease [Pullulanibacillus pueri]MBM7683018.1 multiple sugar transport system permease protein [Pullulanibacillus pueri]GGH89102.1 sugar ABC transporter permease [Pullulanibacillus pueri]